MKADDGTLRRLMVAAQAGDKRAYAVLLEACGDWLRRYYAQKIAVEAMPVAACGSTTDFIRST